MFQLIISILAIILAVALAGVSIYYGGSAFSNGSETAQYATLTNQGSQIEAAMTLYRAQEGQSAHGQTDDAGTTDVDESKFDEVLVAGNYLKQLPTNEFGAWSVVNGRLLVQGIGQAVCDVDDRDSKPTVDANTTAGVDAAMTGVSGCVAVGSTALTAAAAGVDAAVGENIFYYSL